MTLTTAHFSLVLRTKQNSTVLIMQFFNDVITTQQFPHTLQFLKLHAPKVLKTKCFNSLNLSFKQEVINTELGHLFEHILLSYLCEEKIEAGADSAIFDAVTHWNWKRFPKGNFKIVLQGKIDKKLLFTAVTRSIKITDLLFSTNTADTIGTSLATQQQPLVRPLLGNASTRPELN